MALGRDRRIGAVRQTMPAGGTVAGFTPSDVGRALRRTRTRQGLSIQDVSARIGIPVSQLRDVETGALDLPDQLSTLKTVRHYADFLGLPGDRYALALLEHWPAVPGHHAAGAGHRGPVTGVVPRDGTNPTAMHGRPRAMTEVAPTGHPRAAGPATAIVPLVGTPRGREAAPAIATTRAVGPITRVTSVQEASGSAYDDTGDTPAVGAGAGITWSSPPRAPLALRVLVLVVALAVLLGVAGLVVDHVRPSWLHRLGILPSASHPTTATTTATTTAPAGSAPPVSATTAPAAPNSAGHSTGGSSTAKHAPSPTSPTTATMTVGAPFVVRVTAVGGPAWVDVTTPTSSTPLFEGIVNPGQAQSVTVAHSAAVEVGSSAARLSVTAKSKALLATYAPPAAPYTVTFRAGAG